MPHTPPLALCQHSTLTPHPHPRHHTLYVRHCNARTGHKHTASRTILTEALAGLDRTRTADQFEDTAELLPEPIDPEEYATARSLFLIIEIFPSAPLVCVCVLFGPLVAFAD
jgi:hypothetical protein